MAVNKIVNAGVCFIQLQMINYRDHMDGQAPKAFLHVNVPYNVRKFMVCMYMYHVFTACSINI